MYNCGLQICERRIKNLTSESLLSLQWFPQRCRNLLQRFPKTNHIEESPAVQPKLLDCLSFRILKLSYYIKTEICECLDITKNVLLHIRSSAFEMLLYLPLLNPKSHKQTKYQKHLRNIVKRLLHLESMNQHIIGMTQRVTIGSNE